MKGSREDTVSSLTLDPRSSECLSLIARVFPGKSKEDILLLHPVTNEIQFNLRSLRDKMSAKGSEVEARLRPYSPLREFELELKAAGEEDRDENESGVREGSRGIKGERGNERSSRDSEESLTSATLTRYQTGQVELQSPSLPKLRPLRSTVSFLLCHHKDGEHNVLPGPPALPGPSHPPPPPRRLSHLSPIDLRQRVMPLLHHCLQEANFHRFIYYSKKSVSTFIIIVFYT